MIKALIIDDESKARETLKHYIIHFVPEISEIRGASSVEQALRVLQVYQPNIVFLDIEMPGQNGFDFLTSLESWSFDIIFTTAHNQYAIQAIRFSALDYLTKPVNPDELFDAVQRFASKKESAKQKKRLYENLVRNIAKNDVRDFRLGIPSNDGIFFFLVSDIMRLEADRNYTLFHLRGREPFLACKTLRHFEMMLRDCNFVRTHKSHLVNVLHVSHISKNYEFLIMRDDEKIEISRRRKYEVQRMLKFF
jgi:two-component system LytT family response regulator